MTLYGKFLAIIAIILSFAGCSADNGSKLTDYRDSDAGFTLTFPSAYGDVVCDCVRSADCTALTVREPQRSAGLTVTVSENSCTVAVNDCTIPLTPEAADGLTDIIAALYAPLTEPIEASRTPDGENTAVTTPYGLLYLDKNMLPCAVECPTWNGETRTVTVENYIIEENKTSSEEE